jgi:hypothetical protein
LDSLLSTAYLPPVSYFHSILNSEKIFIEACETYPKQTLRNHCSILSPNGIQNLVIPVSKPGGNHTSVREVLISPHEPWQKIHTRSLETAYNSSPFFLYYREDIFPIITTASGRLIDFNTALLKIILELIGIRQEIQFTHSFEAKPSSVRDLRHFHNQGVNPSPFLKPYQQVFTSKFGFTPDLSILDLLFNLGPDSFDYLVNN